MFSDTNVLFTSLWPTVLLALSVVLVIVEYTVVKKHKAIFTAVSAIFTAAACVAMLIEQCSLCDLLVIICATVCVRLLFEIIQARKAK